jgi:RNA polymerase sigma-70 factor (ECF subfamily)
MSDDPHNLDNFRDYLRYLARRQIPQMLRSKMDESSLVQDVYLRVHNAPASFAGLSGHGQIAYLREVLASVLADKYRRFGRLKRNTVREQSLDDGIQDSSEQLGASLAANEPSPIEQADRNECILRLVNALSKLPDNQRAAVEHHFLAGFTLTQTACELGKSTGAIAGLIRRGIKTLREELDTLQ